jgi:hypothetical protein
MLACEGFGRFTFGFDPNSSFILTVSMHPEMIEKDHSSFFLIVSMLLVIAAYMKLVPLKRPFSIVYILFILLFSFISAKSMIGWSFPLSMVLNFIKLNILSC